VSGDWCGLIAIVWPDHGAVQPEHLDPYLDEFSFCFNRRSSRSRGRLF
jgi:hypothetical protein